MKQYLSVKDVARRYGVGVSTVWQWTKDCVLPAPVRFGQRTTRWDSDELDAHDQKAKEKAA